MRVKTSGTNVDHLCYFEDSRFILKEGTNKEKNRKIF